MKEKLWPRIKRWFCGKFGHVAAPDTPRWEHLTFGSGKTNAICKRCNTVFTEDEK